LSVCPYCTGPISEQSQDHIFPQFLGGQKTIICCTACNSTFGYTFEAETAKFLQRWHVFISSWGIPLRSVDPTWRRTLVHEGKPYDLSAGETGVTAKLSHPIIRRDTEGKVETAEFGDKRQAEKFARRMVVKGKAKEVQIEKGSLPQADKPGLGISLEIGADMQRMVMKMCMALSTVLPEFATEEVVTARKFLLAAPSSRAVDTIALSGIYEQLDSRRSPLSHAIYVERNQDRLYGLVQFFGAIQLFCCLGAPVATAIQTALLASLDPVSGDEQVSEIPPDGSGSSRVG
jgi:HNH endonuclease